MAIDRKELLQSPHFEGLGSFLYCRPGNGDWRPSYMLECFGGQVSVEVDESEVSNPPAAGTVFQIGGSIRHNGRNNTVSLVTSTKKQVGTSLEALSPEHFEQFARGLLIHGVGIVHAKDTAVVNRVTYNKATLKCQGATHEFRKLSPEIYQRIPMPGKYVRFDLGLSVREEKNITGQLVVFQMPSILSITAEEMALPTNPVPPKPAAPPPPPKA